MGTQPKAGPDASNVVQYVQDLERRVRQLERAYEALEQRVRNIPPSHGYTWQTRS